jgi:hypothetical protein
MRDYILRGIMDFRAETPWEHAPLSFEEWQAGTEDTPEQLAYWQGYSGAIDETMHRARQRVANGTR